MALILAWIAFPAKLTLALLLNLPRMRNLIEEIKKKITDNFVIYI